MNVTLPTMLIILVGVIGIGIAAFAFSEARADSRAIPSDTPADAPNLQTLVAHLVVGEGLRVVTHVIFTFIGIAALMGYPPEVRQYMFIVALLLVAASSLVMMRGRRMAWAQRPTRNGKRNERAQRVERQELASNEAIRRADAAIQRLSDIEARARLTGRHQKRPNV